MSDSLGALIFTCNYGWKLVYFKTYDHAWITRYAFI